MTITEHLRRRLTPTTLQDLPGVPDTVPDNLAETEWSDEFESRMRARLMQGAFRYGPIGSKKPKFDRIGSASKRMAEYVRTGNAEHLVDAANMLLLEYVAADHPMYHFQSLDDAEHTEVTG